MAWKAVWSRVTKHHELSMEMTQKCTNSAMGKTIIEEGYCTCMVVSMHRKILTLRIIMDDLTDHSLHFNLWATLPSFLMCDL